MAVATSSPPGPRLEAGRARNPRASDDPADAAPPCAPQDTPPYATPAEREALFGEFQPLVRRLIRQYGEDGEGQQELRGEIYCRFCGLLDAFEPERGVPLRAYLVRSLTASVYTFSRSQWRRRQREISLDGAGGTIEPSQPTDPSHEWDQDLMTRDVLQALPAAIAQLPLRQRQVVVWRYYESRSFEEIAEFLAVRPATARSLLRHGLNNLRRQVARRRLVWE